MHIKELTIYSKELEKQVAFYTSTLQLNCIDQSETQASIQIGDSILTIIARKNLNNPSDHPFDASQLLNISEIGLPTLNIEAKYQQLNALSSITRFSGDFDRFLAMGDDHGLFICVNKNIKDWFPTGDTAHSSDFELRFTNEQKDHHIRFEKDEIIQLS